MDVPTGVRNCSIGLMVLWIIYFLGAFFGTQTGSSAGSKFSLNLFQSPSVKNLFSGNWVWAIIWSIANILVYGAVIFGMMKTRKIFLLPALIMSVFDVLVGILNAIINFILLSWFA